MEAQNVPAATQAEPSSWPAPAVIPAPIAFEYTGETQLTAVGSITRRVYRFDRQGEVLEVDSRDMPGMRGVPNLRVVRLPQ